MFLFSIKEAQRVACMLGARAKRARRGKTSRGAEEVAWSLEGEEMQGRLFGYMLQVYVHACYHTASHHAMRHGERKPAVYNVVRRRNRQDIL